MPLADSHIHLFAGGYPGKYGALFPKGGELLAYEAFRRVHHIEQALVIGYEGDPWARGNNQYIARLARQHSWMVPLAFCSLSALPSKRQLGNLWDHGFRGISLYLSEPSNVTKLLGWSEEALSAINEKRAILSINVSLSHVGQLRPFFERVPAARVLVSHLGLPGRVISELSKISAYRVLLPLLSQADLPQVGVKVSALYACNAHPHGDLSPILEALVQSLGEKRLYWGSDFSPALDEVTFTQTIEAAQKLLGGSPPSKAIFRENLRRIVRRVR